MSTDVQRNILQSLSPGFPRSNRSEKSGSGISRRRFLGCLGGVAALGKMAVGVPSPGQSASIELILETGLSAGSPLRVKPALLYQLYERRELTSWRAYGGIQRQADVDKEAKKIEEELRKLASTADFSVQILPLARVASDAEAGGVRDSDCDAMLIYASGGEQRWLETLAASGKPSVMFLRHRSGPIYLWYEIAHWRFLRKSEGAFAEPNMDVWDIVVDDYDEVLWRLRALYGLRNALGTKVIAIGGLQSYSRPGEIYGPAHAKKLWKFDIKSVSFDELKEKLSKANADEKFVREVERQTDEFLGQKNTFLRTDKKSVFNSLAAAKVFKEIMDEAGATNIGVAHCMGALIRVIQTPPCLALSVLNDEGFTAFCHVDFTHTPAGVLLRHISAKPSFVSNSHFPHDGIITLAHCSSPRRMNGKDYEPTKIVTHFESDCGAATKVDYRIGQVTTNLIPNLNCTKWIGFRGKIIATPSYDICRSQMDVEIDGDWRKLLSDMQGFHTITCYGDYLREVGYALGKLKIGWESVSQYL